MVVRGKFQVIKRAVHAYSMDCTEITLSAVGMNPDSEEDRRFNTATPSGQITLQVNNPAAAAALELEKYYYVDFIAVD